MLEKYSDKYNQAKDAFGGLSSGRKVAILALAALILAGFVAVLFWINKPEYGVLYSDLSRDDAAAIVAKLNEQKIPYVLSENSSRIEIPKNQVQEARLILATEGLPTGGKVGLEIFDKSSLGATEFVQKLNYQRALQGELERTIAQFPEVNNVRVHLNIPKQSLFIEEEREPSASVVLGLKRGQSLTRNQLAGIVHLVSSAVEGLKPDHISIVDTDGGLLYAKDETSGASMSEAQIQERRALETALARKVTTMLERVVGPDKAIARVTADLNLEQINTSEEVYDPDRSVIRSEQRLTEKNRGGPSDAAGVPNATYELGTGQRNQTGAGAGGEVYEKTEQTTNYEITKINRQIFTTAGDVKKLSVAVLVAGTYEEKTVDGQTARTLISPTDAELADMERLVKGAVGYDESRGDTVVVTPVSFHSPDAVEESWWTTAMEYLGRFGKPVLYVFAIFLFFLFVVRPVMAWLANQGEPARAGLEQPALPEGEEREILPSPEDARRLVKGSISREQILQLAQQNPERTINLLRSWIDEKDSRG